MVQNSKRNTPHTRPVHRPATTSHVEREEKKCCCGENCGCDSSCTCGCQDGNNSCLATIAAGVMNLVGCLMIAGSILVLVDKPSSVTSAVETETVVAAADVTMDDAAFAQAVEKNVEVIINTVNAYYQKQAAEREAAAPKNVDASMLKEILDDKTNTVMGNPKGSFVVIEFFDYNCGWCKKMNKAMAEAVKKSDNIRWILMDAPIFGDPSNLISRYALAAGKQGKFKEFHEAIADVSDRGEENLKAIAKTVGLDVAKLEKDANSEAVKGRIAKNRKYIDKLQLSGVPMFIVDGKIVRGAFQDEQMAEYIKQAEAMKKAK